MRSLEARLSRLEKQRKTKKHRVPTLREYLDVLPRVQVRNLYSAYSKLDPDLPGRVLDEDDFTMIENDSQEQQGWDENVWRRSEGVHWQESGRAEHTRQRLRSMKRVTVGGPE